MKENHNITLELIPTENYAIGLYILLIGKLWYIKLIRKSINNHLYSYCELLSKFACDSCLALQTKERFVFNNKSHFAKFYEKIYTFIPTKRHISIHIYFVCSNFLQILKSWEYWTQTVAQENLPFGCVHNSIGNNWHYVLTVYPSHADCNKFRSQHFLNLHNNRLEVGTLKQILINLLYLNFFLLTFHMHECFHYCH